MTKPARLYLMKVNLFVYLTKQQERQIFHCQACIKALKLSIRMGVKMQIEIVTTKKKLTKSILNQMRYAPTSQIRGWEVLGYVVKCVKTLRKALLIKFDDEYYIFPTDINECLNCFSRGIEFQEYFPLFTLTILNLLFINFF